jgi:hypothetical protein
MADSLTARKLVREHLETHFDEYLSSVSSYLRQAYPELHLTEEASQEIAATVIVRVSHADLDPSHVEQALTDGADEMIRARRPRLTHGRRGEELGGPLRAEAPRPLPSLRLIQSFGRTPANSDGNGVNTDGVATGASGPDSNGGEHRREVDGSDVLASRLLLANPPRDLGATIGWKNDEPWKDENAIEPPTSERLGAHVLVGGAFLGNAAAGTLVSERDAPTEDTDNLVTGEHLRRAVGREERDESTDVHEIPSALRVGTVASEQRDVVTSEESGRDVASPSSAPPTQGSVIPPQLESATLEKVASEHTAAPETPRTRRKNAAPKTSKATGARAKANSKSSKSKAAVNGARSRASAGRGKAAQRGKSSERRELAGSVPGVAPTAAVPYVSDDLAVIAMVGFPGNPRRAAKLCVTAMAEELGLDDDADLSPQVLEVTRVLESLRDTWAQGVPPDAHLVWQKRARQATLRAFLNSRG